MVWKNILALIGTIAIALAWLRACDLLAKKEIISSKLSRKIIHIGTGPIFVLCWLLFNSHDSARWLAAIVPLLITIQFAMIGLGLIKDDASVKAMSRSGDRREILLGPLFYGIIFVLLTIIYWKDSPVGLIALMILCGGDGFADIIGKRFGKKIRIPWAKEKSLIGSIAMLVGGMIFSTALVSIFLALNIFSGEWLAYFYKIVIICLAATVIESLPFKNIDNLSVPVVAVIVGELLF